MGKGDGWGGSEIRPEATGYGCVFYAQEALADLEGQSLEGKRCTISGSGNVAQYTAEKLLQLGAKPLTFSDSSGFIHEPDGFSEEQVAAVMTIKNAARGRVADYLSQSRTATFHEGQRPWAVPCDLAFPSATQNEIDGDNAKALARGGCKGVFEGANMPSTPEAVEVFKATNVIFGPGKAANAGGVAVSGLEMSQNSQMISWDRKTVEDKLQGIMRSIYSASSSAAKEYGRDRDLKFGANVAGFKKVANALRSHGV